MDVTTKLGIVISTFDYAEPEKQCLEFFFLTKHWFMTTPIFIYFATIKSGILQINPIQSSYYITIEARKLLQISTIEYFAQTS